MKIKKEKVERIVLGILTFILISYITFTLIFLSIFNVSKRFLNKDNVLEFVNRIDVITIIKKELGSEVEEFIVIENQFKEIGITDDGLNEFVSSSDVKDFSTTVVIDIFDKIINQETNDHYIQNIDVTNLIENNIDKLQINSELTQTQILDKLSSKIPNLVSNINKLIDKLCQKLENSNIFNNYKQYINMSVGILDIIHSDITYFLILFILISFIVLLVFIRKDIYKSLKWISISFIIPGILIFILNYIIINKFIIDNSLIINVISVITRNLNFYSYMYILIGVIIIIINIIIYSIKKRQKKYI